MVKRTAQTKRSFSEPALLSAGSVILHELARTGASTFRQITHSNLARTAGSHLNENSYYTAIARLRKRRLIDKGGYGYALTPTGEWAAMKAAVQRGLQKWSNRRAQWDGKWRIVLFDFPEKKRPYRDYVRGVLRKLDFKEFQRSTWISPCKLPHYADRLFKDPRVAKYIRVFTTHDVNYDRDLRRKFKLS